MWLTKVSTVITSLHLANLVEHFQSDVCCLGKNSFLASPPKEEQAYATSLIIAKLKFYYEMKINISFKVLVRVPRKITESGEKIT